MAGSAVQLQHRAASLKGQSTCMMFISVIIVAGTNMLSFMVWYSWLVNPDGQRLLPV